MSGPLTFAIAFTGAALASYLIYRRNHRYRRLGEPLGTYLVLALADDTAVASLEADRPADELLRELVVRIAGRDFIRLSYPTIPGADHPGGLPDHLDLETTIALEVLVPVNQIVSAWTQRKAYRP